ncbi:hypothetical protein TNCV_2879991 [Trichonephila clavipes]|uniref:Uncharacterized protein n=1 Tax=Trichonephila clavipes TaxID=2585209 RepID=A0A8X7BC94_TRICX|nr:hypothetical protein TNCV_2879991 [Trichonephila clavipes]
MNFERIFSELAGHSAELHWGLNTQQQYYYYTKSRPEMNFFSRALVRTQLTQHASMVRRWQLKLQVKLQRSHESSRRMPTIKNPITIDSN